ncbi:Yippee-like protein, partial [Cynara cardunculus var. scolymus]
MMKMGSIIATKRLLGSDCVDLLLIESSQDCPSCSLFTSSSMGRLFLVTLEGKIYSCKHCKTHLALCDDIVSKSFHCKHGKAYLFSKVSNVTVGVKEDRLMMTGLHTVADIFCVKCGSIVGWTYNRHTSKHFNLELCRSNVTVRVKESRLTMTGLHTVVEIFCVKCGSIVSWTY